MAALAIGPEHRVNTTTQGDQSDPAIASLAGGGYVVTWSVDFAFHVGAEVRTQRFDVAENPIGSEILTAPGSFTESQFFDPAVVGLADGEFVVGYASLDSHFSFYHSI